MTVAVDFTGDPPKYDAKIKEEDNFKHGRAFPLAAKPERSFPKYPKDNSHDAVFRAEDPGKICLSSTNQSNSGLWEKAWELVKSEERDWELWPQFQRIKDCNTKNAVEEIHGVAQRCRDDAEKHQGHVLGTSHTYREVCSKVTHCAKKFQIVGDLVAQAEPVYAALPWTFVRFVIECAVSESDTWDSMLEGTNIVTTHISKYPVIERLYAHFESDTSKGLQGSLLNFYILMLKFQVHAIKYFDPNHKGRRTVEGMNPLAADRNKKELQAIQTAKERVDADIVIVDAEITKLGIDNLKEGQDGQREQLEAIKGAIKALSQDLSGDLSASERHQQERHKDLIDMWKGSLDDLKSNAEKHRVEMEANYLAAVRAWLSVAAPWEDHKIARAQRQMPLGKWLAEDSKFQVWHTSEMSSILWLHGFTGTGKTGLVCNVIEDVRKNLKDQETGQESSRLAIFYCSNDKAKTGREESFSRADPKEALRSVVSQLTTTVEGRSVVPIVREKFEAFGPGSDRSSKLDYPDCVEIVVEISKILPITIILDALDECYHNETPVLIKHLKEIVRHVRNPVKIFISTRSFSAIEKELTTDLSIEVTAQRNNGDVLKFIETTLEDYIRDKMLLDGVVDPKLKRDIVETLASRAGNMFLYASLVLNRLCDKRYTNDAESIRKKLDEFPSNLADVYRGILAEIHDAKNNSPRSCRLAQDTFKWLLCAQEPPQLEYQSILEAISPPERKADLQEVRHACRDLAVEEANILNFAHYSVREHVVQMDEYSPSRCNIVATRSCLRVLNTFFGSDQTTRQQFSEAQKSLKDYALLYWPFHYTNIAESDMAEHRADINAMLRSLLLKGPGDRDKYHKYEEWFNGALRLAEPLGNNKDLTSKLNALRANPPTPLFAACVFGLEDLISRFGRELDGLNKYNERDQSALCLAIENNKPKTVNALLSRRFPADLNLLNVKAVQQFERWNLAEPSGPREDILYASALQCAAATGNLEIADFLIGKGAHVDLVAGYLGSALQAACLKGHAPIVELLLRKGAEPNSQGGFHGNALQAAAAGGHSDIINLLLENRPPALVGTPGGYYGSALMAAVCSGSSECVFALLEERANPRVREKNHGTPLEKAVSMGKPNKDVIEVLIDYEAEADLSPTGKGVHMLHRAARYGMVKLVNYCLDEGCHIDMTTIEGPDYNPKARFNWFPREMTPLGYACAEGHLAVVTALLDRGAPFEEDRAYSAPLWAAAYQGHADVVDLLITRFKDTHNGDPIAFMDHLPDPDAGRHYILFAAASSGNPEVVRVLLEHHAPYRANWFGATPLFATITFRCPAVTEILLKYHKDGKVDVRLDQQSQIGRTALFKACAEGRFVIASQLLDAGANPFIPNNDNGTTLHEACHYENYKLVEKLVSKASELADRSEFLKFLDTRHRPSGNTALLDCAERNNLSSLSLLLNNGANLLISNNEGETALHRACRRDNFNLVEMIVNKAQETTDHEGFRKFIDRQPSSHKTALIECAEHNQLQALKLLLGKGADYTLHGHFGNTPLLWASMNGHYDVVVALLEHAKQEEHSLFKDFIDHKNRDGVNAVFEAAGRGYLPIVGLLLDEGIDWSVVKKPGATTALHAASWGGRTEVVSKLLTKAYETASQKEFKDFLNHCNDQGKTALLDAAQTARIEIARQLVEKYEAEYLTTDKNQCSALNMACFEGHTEVVAFLLQVASTRLSRERFLGFLNQRNKWGNTAFFDAAQRGQLEVVEILLERKYGGDYLIANENNVTPLHASSWNGHKAVVAFLLKTASEDTPPEHVQKFLNLRNKWGKTALMDAAQQNNADIIDLLLSYGADYSICDNNDFTALHYCAFRNHMAAVRILLSKTSVDATDNGEKFKRFLNQQGKGNRATALRDAAIQKHTDVAKYILQYGPAYDLIDSGKRTALHQALGRWDEDLGLALLEYARKDPDRERFRRFVNAKEERGDTVWVGANRRGFHRLVERLKACAVVERV